ncbi:hypothetical protein [Zeimonas arvi]|uniref:Uncharacterized protein n=1 Tax=Zeimonas arvi TaxID=2498847 RepID=A0A5C8NZZ9_9BURK|nr:hypothetical protein [Zeimonas arvi]TXL66885.1 hypothetical protein FHP08_04455 [Zeimonas arvi]
MMRTPPSRALVQLSQRYARTDIPAGEAFHAAFRRYLRANRESLLDVTAAAASVHIGTLSNQEDVDPLLLRAIRETNPLLDESRLFEMNDEALQGAVNTSKGKYFEHLVAQRLNAGEQVGPLLLEPGQTAVLAESMTQPGWDLRILDANGSAVEYLQLKATDSVGYVRAALERYPDIQILATNEVSASGLVVDSGISNQDLREKVGSAVEDLDESLVEAFLEHFHLLLPLAAVALYEGRRLAIGSQSLDEFKLALSRRGQRIVATQAVGVAVYALDGGLLSIPAAIAGGLIFDRTVNQTGLAASYASHRDKLMALRLQQQERVLSKELA